MDGVIIPEGLTLQEYSDTQHRLDTIEAELRTRFCADDKFCSQYFESQVGTCTLVSGICRKHVPNPPLLPPGFMCAHEYGVRLSHNKTAMDEKKTAKVACKRALDTLQNEEALASKDSTSQGEAVTHGDTASRGGDSFQCGVKRRRLTLQYKMIHLQSELLALEGEYYNLCVHQTPVDAAQVHAELRKLLRERADLKLRLKIGKPQLPSE